MQVLGINTSHDSTVAVVEDGKLKHLYEEARIRRQKWWSPVEEGGPPVERCGYMTLQHKGLTSPDVVTFASFDRRDTKLNLTENVHNDRGLQKSLIEFISEKQFSIARYHELERKFGTTVVSSIEQHLTSDEHINMAVMSNTDFTNQPISSFEGEHHYYHAVCADYFSPYDESLVITWDGGGWQSLFDTHPGYQEIECIYYAKDGLITPLYKKLSNNRHLDAINQDYFPGFTEDCVYCLENEFETRDGIDYEFTALPSNGMNFSNMSVTLGCDDLGRGAGKVMGMASYSRNPQIPNVFSRHTTAQLCEIESLKHAKTVIQKAIDYKPECKNIVLSGGFSLNCTNNYKYLQAFPEHNFFVDPVPHDGGTAVGSALDYWRKNS